MKECKTCFKTKNLENFYSHPQMKDGHVNICIECKINYSKNQRNGAEFICITCGTTSRTSAYRARNNISKVCSVDCRTKYFAVIGNKPPVMSGEKHPEWKGNNIKYHTMHEWINDTYGRRKVCDLCGTEDQNKRYEWANKDHKYKRDINEWMRLCVGCHRAYDCKNNRKRK